MNAFWLKLFVSVLFNLNVVLTLKQQVIDWKKLDFNSSLVQSVIMKWDFVLRGSGCGSLPLAPEEKTLLRSFECGQKSKRRSYRDNRLANLGNIVPRLVSGGQYEPERFPSYVLIKHYSKDSQIRFCGGTLIGRSSDLVLTSIGCVNPLDDRASYEIEVVAGVSEDLKPVKEKGGQLRGVKLVCRNSKSESNLVLLQLTSGFMQNGVIQTACLTKENHKERAFCFTIGGSLDTPDQNKILVSPMIRLCSQPGWSEEYGHNESCYRSLGVGGPCWYNGGAPMLCVHTCNFYEPLRAYLVGVFSRASPNFKCEEHRKSTFPSFYTDLYKIRHQLNNRLFFDDCYRPV